MQDNGGQFQIGFMEKVHSMNTAESEDYVLLLNTTRSPS